MANYNKVILMGNLTRDPELRYTKNGSAVAEFGLAINREYTDSNNQRVNKACFVDIIAWKRTGELIAEYLTKGSPIFLEGRLEFDQWETPDGQKRSKLRVVAEHFQFIGGREAGAGRKAGGNAGASSAMPAQPPVDNQYEEDIPF